MFLSCFGSYRSLLDILGSSCVEELENIIPKVHKQTMSKYASVFSHQFNSAIHYPGSRVSCSLHSGGAGQAKTLTPENL
jgi:hypothetical protein